MQIINNKTVLVGTSEELKTVLSEENTYTYIYLANDITAESGFTINSTKEEVTIDGTYNDTRYTYTNNLSIEADVISASTKNKKITLKNMNIINSHPYGVIYVPSHPNYSNTVIEYNNINFNGIELSCNYYGVTKIVDSTITIEDTSSVPAQRACDSNRIIVSGTTTINSTSTTNTIIFLNDVISSYFKILPNSKVSVTTTKEFMNGTNKLDLIVSHNSEFILTTGNGFAKTTTHGARNVTIEEFATFTFIENSHQRVPFWNVYGNFIVKEGAALSIINTYMSTPTDNYNIYFKGTNQKFILENPKYVKIYTKNANIFYTINPVEFTFKFSRINLWIEAKDYLTECTLDDLPTLSWHKDNSLAKVTGTFSKDTTEITSHNFTAEELSNFPDLDNFSFQGRKILTIGLIKLNIHPITSSSTAISGHTLNDVDIKIEYDGNAQTVKSDSSSGLFTSTLAKTITDETSIKITACLNGIYTERKITSPSTGELTLLKVTEDISFSKEETTEEKSIIPKKGQIQITVIDSRVNGTLWRLYINSINPMIESTNNSVLIDSLIFNDFDNQTFKVNTTKHLIYQETNKTKDVEVSNIIFPKEKGLLLSPSKDLSEGEDYSTLVIWTLEE